MLLALSLNDFVIVDRLNLDFQPGFTVLTGETGAGKSITLDAIGLLLGDKADYGQIRQGAAEARLSALFDLSELPELQAELREQGLLAEDAEELSIRRIIDAKGKSRSYINNQAATLSQLKSIGSRLIDIHGQNAHHSLNQEAAQRELLDAFAGCTALAGEVKAAYQNWQNANQALKAAEALSRIEPRFNESLNLLASIEAELGEVSANMRDVASRSDLDPAELAAQEQRLGELMGMARKYRVEPQDLPAKMQEIEAALQQLQAAAHIAALEAAAERCEKQYHEAAQQLSAGRRQAAERLGSETAAHMQELAMKGARFHIELLPASPSAFGLEQVQYQVAANKGSPLRPLNKVASGGELARISLALQVVASQYTQTPTLIFDEVDTGIGGGVAETVGRALRSLGRKHQVLAVTHLPQVAACGEQHWQVRKNSEGEQTVSSIRVLSAEERVEEIARMLGGETLTATTRSHAAELLEMAAR